MSGELVHRFLINLANCIETLETNALEEGEHRDRKYESMESDVDLCFDRIETLEFDYADGLDTIESLQKSVETLHIRQNTLEQRHKKMMKLHKGLVKELLEGLERNKREVMIKQEVEMRLLKEEIRRLKDEPRSNTHLTEQSIEKILKHEISGKSEENVRNDSEEVQVENTVRAKPNITQATPANDGIVIIKPPGSESKRNTRRPDVPSPTPAPATQNRRLRKKKPFIPDDNVVGDVKPTERYNLRNRKPRQ